MNRETSQYLINPKTNTPIADVLKISKVLDKLDNTKLPELDEKFMVETFFEFITEEEHSFYVKDISSEFIEWFNESKIKRYIEEEMTEEEYKQLEKVWQNLK